MVCVSCRGGGLRETVRVSCPGATHRLPAQSAPGGRAACRHSRCHRCVQSRASDGDTMRDCSSRQDLNNKRVTSTTYQQPPCPLAEVPWGLHSHFCTQPVLLGGTVATCMPGPVQAAASHRAVPTPCGSTVTAAAQLSSVN